MAPAQAKTYDEIKIKLMMIGDTCVGKTSLLLRYAEDEYNSNVLATIGIDFKIKTVELEGQRVKMQIWDTAGQERFKTITQAYYRGAQGIFLIYDITQLHTFENIRQWVENIKRHAENGGERVNKILIGNKCDMDTQRKVTFEDGEKLREDCGIDHFFETSAKSNIGVQEAFTKLASVVTKRLIADGTTAQQSTAGIVQVGNEKKQGKKPCCK